MLVREGRIGIVGWQTGVQSSYNSAANRLLINNYLNMGKVGILDRRSFARSQGERPNFKKNDFRLGKVDEEIPIQLVRVLFLALEGWP